MREGYLINPVVVDARTDITTQLLSDQGYAVAVPVADGDAAQESFFQKDFEKKFCSKATNRLFCSIFPAEFYTQDKLRRTAGVDRRLTLREILEKIFDLIPYFKGKDELLEDEFQKFLLDQPPAALNSHAAASSP